MNQYEASTYGERIAEVFDQWYAGQDTEGAVEFLSGLAGGGTFSNSEPGAWVPASVTMPQQQWVQ